MFYKILIKPKAHENIYILLKYQFFFNYFTFFIHDNNHPLSFFFLNIHEEKKIRYKINSGSVNLYGYCNKCIFTQFCMAKSGWTLDLIG